MDPYTGASRYSGAEQSAVALPSAPPFQPVVNLSSLFVCHRCSPNVQTNFVPFKQANVPAMQAKLFQFNDDLRNEIVSRTTMF
jgi:phospholipase A-2-activating protein